VRIRLLAVGTRMPAWVETAFADYQSRLPHECRLELTEIVAPERGRRPDLARLRQAEGEKLLKAVPADCTLIALDERGSALNTAEWAQQLQGWMASGRDTALIIGGADGLAPEVLARAAQRWSLSRLTLPHPLVRVLVAEQLYRAWSILAHHPYHRA
jgi:23S rRNA (pseudouridine1915-N3)-methyltransferase